MQWHSSAPNLSNSWSGPKEKQCTCPGSRLGSNLTPMAQVTLWQWAHVSPERCCWHKYCSACSGWQGLMSSAQHGDGTLLPNPGLDTPLKIKSRARCPKEVKHHMDPFREMRWKHSNTLQLQHGKTVSCGFIPTCAYIKFKNGGKCNKEENYIANITN